MEIPATLTIPPEIEARIAALSVSEKWKTRFRLMAQGEPFKSGIPTNLAKLPMGIRFNFWGFLFGPIYYFWLGLWQKGITLLGFGWLWVALLACLEGPLNYSFPGFFYSLPLATVCAQFGAIDHYKLKIHGIKIWNILKPLENIGLAILFCLACFAVLFILIPVSPEDMETQPFTVTE